MALLQQQQEQLATRQRAVGVSPVAAPDESQEMAVMRMMADNPAEARRVLDTVGVNTQQQKEDAAAFATEALSSSPDRLPKLIGQRVQKLASLGRDPSETLMLLDLPPQDQVSALMGLKAAALTELQRTAGGAGASEREFESLMEGFSEEEKAKARRVRAGLTPRAIGSAAQTIAETGLAASVGESQAIIKQQEKFAEEAGKLKAQLKLEPSVANAVVTAKNDAALAMKVSEEGRSNDLAFSVYETAMSGLAGSLGGTATGPAVGYMPAITSNQQIAEGAIAAMAPVLKAIFRASGEGTFTDSDQKLLMSMLPTRRDSPAARKSKLENVDAIVRMKLGQSLASPAATQAAPAQQPAAAGPMVINTQAEFDALPSGAVYIDPDDNKQYRKP